MDALKILAERQWDLMLEDGLYCVHGWPVGDMRPREICHADPAEAILAAERWTQSYIRLEQSSADYD